MNNETIKLLVKENKYDEALSVCKAMLEYCDLNDRPEILRMRAYTYSHMGDYLRALTDREEVLQLGECTLKDLYLTADNALNLGEFKLASSVLKDLLELGAKQNEHWFDSAAYFELSYAQMELGNYKESLTNLEKAIDVEPNCAMPLPSQGMVGYEKLKREITRRMNKL